MRHGLVAVETGGPDGLTAKMQDARAWLLAIHRLTGIYTKHTKTTIGFIHWHSDPSR